ncbi:hypothetical protein [Streptomyces flavofungini]|uniref:hypothetical protein n=1 Tax=Streptomyces flavofungini TaxID=68200 RepID=UPI0025B0E47B|nr:hypothetical protein [Streptomyces flavofungini]WJV48090.1 hypothetical protein QUY26_22765 [Streptomyces flavofungini]
MPRTALFWRSAATVTDVLATPPDPAVVQFDGYLPDPCLLAPEQVVEYPSTMESNKELRERRRSLRPREPTRVQVGSGYEQQLYVCPRAPEHPRTEPVQ